MPKKYYTIYPNFAFTVEAENETEANAVAYQKLQNAHEITDGGFDFEIEEDIDAGEVEE